MSNCQRCGLPTFGGAMGYVGPQCRCWANYAPDVPPHRGAFIQKQLTEADVRRIVREELNKKEAS